MTPSPPTSPPAPLDLGRAVQEQVESQFRLRDILHALRVRFALAAADDEHEYDGLHPDERDELWPHAGLGGPLPSNLEATLARILDLLKLLVRYELAVCQPGTTVCGSEVSQQIQPLPTESLFLRTRCWWMLPTTSRESHLQDRGSSPAAGSVWRSPFFRQRRQLVFVLFRRDVLEDAVADLCGEREGGDLALGPFVVKILAGSPPRQLPADSEVFVLAVL